MSAGNKNKGMSGHSTLWDNTAGLQARGIVLCAKFEGKERDARAGSLT
jgi:hypothetical protein